MILDVGTQRNQSVVCQFQKFHRFRKGTFSLTKISQFLQILDQQNPEAFGFTFVSTNPTSQAGKRVREDLIGFIQCPYRLQGTAKLDPHPEVSFVVARPRFLGKPAQSISVAFDQIRKIALLWRLFQHLKDLLCRMRHD